MRKKFLAMALTLCMVVSMLPGAALAAEFSDMPKDYSEEALQNAVTNGLLSGAEGKIMPNDNLTRAQMAAVLVRAFGADKKASLTSFTDVANGAWYYNELSSAVYMGIFKGDGNSMRPNAPITRQEAFTVLARAFGLSSADVSNLDKFADKSSISDWAKSGVAAMVATGFVKGDGQNISPLANITRKDFAVTMDRMVKTYIAKSGTVTTVAEGSVMVNEHGATLKDVTVKGNLIIGDGVGDGDATLDKVVVNDTTLVRGGGANSIYVKNASKLNTVVIAKVDGKVSFKMSGESTANTILVQAKDVTLSGIPQATKVVLSNEATGVTVNGYAVNPGETVVPKPESSSSGSIGGGSVSVPSVSLGVETGKDSVLVLNSTDDNTVKLAVKPENLGSSVSYSYESSNTGVATVLSGVVTAVKAGTSQITVTATYDTNKTVTATLNITVIDSKSIKTAEELKVAFASDATSIVLAANISDVEISRANSSECTIDMGTYTVGTMTVNSETIKLMTVNGTKADGNQIAKLVINTPEATFKNNVITGFADIKKVSNNSYEPTKTHETGMTLRKGNLNVGTLATEVFKGEAKLTIEPISKEDIVMLTGTSQLSKIELTSEGKVQLNAPVKQLDILAKTDITVSMPISEVGLKATAGGTDLKINMKEPTGIIGAIASDAYGANVLLVSGALDDIKINVRTNFTVDGEDAVVKAVNVNGNAADTRIEAVKGTIEGIKADSKIEVAKVEGVIIPSSFTGLMKDEVVVASAFEVIFNAKGGTASTEKLIINDGAKVNTIPTAENPGYQLKGWFTEETNGTQLIADTVITAKITYYAQWTINSYSITYELNGGKNDADNPLVYSITDETIILKPATKMGHEFLGWYSDSGFVNKVTEIAKGSWGDKTFYANWRTYDRSDVNKIIAGGIDSVNTAISNNGKYAAVTISDNSIVTSIKNGTKNVAVVYFDVIDTLLQKLKKNTDKVTSVYTGGYTIKLSDDVTEEMIKAFVKAGGLKGTNGADLNANDKISVLDGQAFTVNVTDVNNVSYGYTISFKIEGKAVVDRILNDGIVKVNNVIDAKGGYAKLSISDKEIDVDIKTGTVKVADVYTDIVATLLGALKENAGKVTSVYTGDEESKNVITLSNAITQEDIKAFVKASGLKGASGAVVGTDVISSLDSQNITITVVAADGIEYLYKISFRWHYVG